MLPPDLHIHSKYCGHARGNIEETVQMAVTKGMTIMGFADHFPYPEKYNEPYPDCVIPRDVFPVYWEEVIKIQNQFASKIEILSGIEVDYLPDYTDIQKHELSQYPFDYVIGSIHILKGFPIDTTPELTQKALAHFGSEHQFWNQYWDAVISLLDTDICDILGHLDLLKKYLPLEDYKPFMEKITYILERIKNENKAIDFNMGGIDRARDKKPYPSQDILERASEIRVDISFGSDSHAPEQVGRYFTQAVELLKSMGWKQVVYYRQREKMYYSI